MTATTPEPGDLSGAARPTAEQLFEEFEQAFAARGGDTGRAQLMVAIADAIAAYGSVPEQLMPTVEEVAAA